MATYYGFSGDRYATYDYDSLNRLKLRTFSTKRPLYSNYLHFLSERGNDGDVVYKTNQLRTEIIDNTAYRYTYDDVGNVTQIEKGVRTTKDSSSSDATGYSIYKSYEYDALGQLKKESNNSSNTSSAWTYDRLGNIQTRTDYTTENGVTTQTGYIDYQYGADTNEDADVNSGFNKLLKNIDLYKGASDNKSTRYTILYDEIGNPIQYDKISYNENGEQIGTPVNVANLTWHGRQLESLNNVADGINVEYVYDADGLRGSKTVNDAKTTYTYVGDKLCYQHTANADGTTNYELYFFYDSTGALSVIQYFLHSGNTVSEYTYYVLCNASGDVLGLYGGDGVLRVSYEYDAWGNIIAVRDANKKEITNLNSIAHRNPIRYRGYYYDTDLDLYYLQSRYYDSTIGRFINADGYITTGQGVLSHNMFAYCQNNPIVFSDPNGCGIIAAIVFGSLALAGILFLGGCSSEPTSDVGSAKPYVNMPGSTDETSPNCYAYAIGSPVNEQPGATSGRAPTNWNDVNVVGKSVEADLKAKGYTVRVISGPDAKVYDNEFKIALRVGTKPYAYNRYTGQSYYDYHFMRQTDTGQWAEKHGYGGPSVLWDAGMTPDNIPWTLNDVPYYDSDIIYYAVGN